MRTIAFIGALPPPVNGLSNANSATLNALAGAGYRMRVYNVAPVSDRGPFFHHWSRLAAVAACVKDLVVRPDFRLAYLPVDGGLGLAYGIGLVLLFRLLRKPIIAHHHSFAYIDKTSLLMRLFARLAPKNQVHVFLCSDMQLAFEARYHGDLGVEYRGLVLSNAFMIPALRLPKIVDVGKSFVIGHLSNLSFDKGTDLFLDLFECLVAGGMPVNARLGGPINDPSLAWRISQIAKRFPEHFRYDGAVYGAQKAAFFSEIVVFVFPTRYKNEAQPLVLLEALAAGCIIATISRGCIKCDLSGSGSYIAPGVEQFVSGATHWITGVANDQALLQRLQEISNDNTNHLFDVVADGLKLWLSIISDLCLI